MNAVEVTGLQKAYDGVEAVRGIDFELRTGEVFGLLGPNGAGKTTTVEILEGCGRGGRAACGRTTTVEILEGYRQRDGGEVRVLGVDPERDGRDWRARIGV